MRTNWSGHHPFQAAEFVDPGTTRDAVTAIRAAGAVKALGAGHCFNDIADTPGLQLGTRRLNRVLHLGHDSVTVEPGILYGELCVALQAAGRAIHNVPSLPHVTVAGACATATHGSGDANRCLSAAVTGMQLIDGAGAGHTLTRDTLGDAFDGVVVHLGALGVVSALTLRTEPAFDMQQVVYTDVPWEAVLASLDAVTGAAYSVSLFPRWRGAHIEQVWLKHRVDGVLREFPPHWLGGTLAARKLHPLSELAPDACTEQLGTRGVWHERLHHFKLAFTPSAGDELQSEYFVARAHAVPAIQALRALGDDIAPVLMTSEIRTVAADAYWLSPCHGRDSVALHFTWRRDWPRVAALLPRIEAVLEGFDARPHWGKLFVMPARRLHALYPRMADFAALRARFDPRGKFDNAWLRRVFG